MGHQARKAHQGDVPTSSLGRQNVFLCHVVRAILSNSVHCRGARSYASDVSAAVREGWYQDPDGRHEFRWFSAGVPTDLVQDGTRASRDPVSTTDQARIDAMDLGMPPDTAPLLIRPGYRKPSIGSSMVLPHVAERITNPKARPPGRIEASVTLLPIAVGLPVCWATRAPYEYAFGAVGASLAISSVGGMLRNRQRRRQSR